MKRFLVRNTTPQDFELIKSLCRSVYPDSPTWSTEQLESHLRVFPEGQLVALDAHTGELVGFAASLIVYWNDYDMQAPWRDFTAGGMFTNHDPKNGRTLYGAEIMVHPKTQGRGAGTLLYRARTDIARRHGLLRIRAGARLRGYHAHAARMSAEEYTLAVVKGQLSDPTLSFQLRRGFHVLGVVSGYLRHDPESLGYAAIIEWINSEVAKTEDYEHRRRSRFYVRPVKSE